MRRDIMWFFVVWLRNSYVNSERENIIVIIMIHIIGVGPFEGVV